MRHLPFAGPFCGGAVVAVVADQREDPWLMGVGCLVAMGGPALGIACARDRRPRD